MSHDTPLISLIVGGLVLAFVFGSIARKLRLSPIVGYLAAGVAVGPFTPGFVGDAHFASELAELGVILLMFGVGLHFSIADLVAVRRIAVPGAVGQMAFATALGWGLGAWLGWDMKASLVFGLALSVASTVVLLRALEEADMVETSRGRIAVGWLVVEDLAMVLALVLLPSLSGTPAHGGTGSLAGDLAVTLAKVAAFVAIMYFLGRRAVPWVLGWAARQVLKSCSRWPCWPSLWASPWPRRRSLASRSRSAPLPPASPWRNPRSASARRRTCCRCAMPSPCCSSSLPACCSTGMSC